MNFASFAAYAKTQIGTRRTQYGSSVKKLPSTTFNAVVSNLDSDDLAKYFGEAGTNPVEDRGILIDDVDPAVALSVGDLVLWPSTGATTDSQWRVTHLPAQHNRAGVAIKQTAVAIFQPDRS